MKAQGKLWTTPFNSPTEMGQTSWKDFFTSSDAIPTSSNSKITSIQDSIFLRYSFFSNIEGAIRVTTASRVQSLIADSFFSGCYSSDTGGVVKYVIQNGYSVLCRVCGYNCFSATDRHFGIITVGSSFINHVNYSSFSLCPSEDYENMRYGSITCHQGFQIGNNINASHNRCGYECGIIFFEQDIGSRLTFVVCEDCKSQSNRVFYVGKNVTVSLCTVIRCECIEDLIKFQNVGEIFCCNIINCKADHAVGSLGGIVKAHDLYMNFGIKVDENSIIFAGKLPEMIRHPHNFLVSHQCRNGIVFPSLCSTKAQGKLSLIFAFQLI